jgi:hypothetical protein
MISKLSYICDESMSSTSLVERRSAPRIPASVMVHYASESLALAGVATNLSHSGLFVESELLDMVGTKAWIEVSDGTWCWMSALGEVVRTVSEDTDGAPGMGIRFLQLGPGASTWIDQYCETFLCRVRILLAHGDRARLRHAGELVRECGGNPLCLTPELVTVHTVERLHPKVIIVGQGISARRSLALVDGLSRAMLLHDAPIYLSDDLDEAVKAAAIDAGAVGFVNIDDQEGLRQIVDDAQRRSDRHSPPWTRSS